jgi:hypothetical protein
MLAFEREVVDALVDDLADPLVDSDVPSTRAAVMDWVDASLRGMPELIRLGVIAESVGLMLVSRVVPGGPGELMARLDRSPIGLLRQYPRLFRSLVLFGDLELRADRAAA